MVPNRDTILVTGSDDTDGLLKLAELAGPELESHRLVSGDAFILRSGEWEIFLLEPTHLAAEALGNLSRNTRCADYNEQKNLIDQVFSREGLDIHVPKCLIAEYRGQQRSGVVWFEGADDLIPRRDLIVFIRPSESEDSRYLAVRWEDAQSLVKKYLEEHDQLLRPAALSHKIA